LTSRRIQRLADSGSERVEQIIERIESALEPSRQAIEHHESSSLISKRSRLLLKYIQLLYQDIFCHVKEFWESQADEQQKESARKESFDRSTILSTSDHLQGNQQPGPETLRDPSRVPPQSATEGEEHDSAANLTISEQ